jgi:hypothetical protein
VAYKRTNVNSGAAPAHRRDHDSCGNFTKYLTGFASRVLHVQNGDKLRVRVDDRQCDRSVWQVMHGFLEQFSTVPAAAGGCTGRQTFSQPGMPTNQVFSTRICTTQLECRVLLLAVCLCSAATISYEAASCPALFHEQ